MYRNGYTSIDTAAYRYAGLGGVWAGAFSRLRRVPTLTTNANGAGPEIITPPLTYPIETCRGTERLVRGRCLPIAPTGPQIITRPPPPNGYAPPTVLDNGGAPTPAAAGIPGGTLGILLGVGLLLALMAKR